MNTPAFRTIIFVITFVLVVVLPWLVSIFLLVGLSIYFPLYLEVLFFGFLFDTLYSARYGFPYTGLSLATLFLLVTIVARTRVRI